MKLRSIFYSVIFTGTALLGVTSCDKKVESPCAELTAAIKKLPNGETMASAMQQSCDTSFKAMVETNKDMAAAYSEGVKACLKKDKIEDMGPCLAEAAQKAAAKAVK